MSPRHPFRPILALFALASIVSPLRAQEADSTDYDAQRRLVQATLGTLVQVVKSAALPDRNDTVGNRLQDLAERLNTLSSSIPAGQPVAEIPAGPGQAPFASAQTIDDPEDLRTIEQALNELFAQVRELRATLEADEEYALAEQMTAIEEGLDRAVVQTRRLVRRQEAVDAPAEEALAREDRPEWLRPGRYEDGDRVSRYDEDEEEEVWEGDTFEEEIARAMEELRREVDDARHTTESVRDRHNSLRYRYEPFDRYDEAEAFVGEFYNRWPFRETGLYRPIPSIRYNRVEGLVLGARFLPLEWGDYDEAKVYGQASYAFELKKPRLEGGAELAPFGRGNGDFEFKVGGAYRYNTGTNDLWKIGWVENTLAAMFFEYDYMDYYETDGFTLYASQRLTPFLQLTAGYRDDRYRSLGNTTTWSLFGASEFRPNPAIDEGRMESFVFALEGGMLSHFSSYPRGFAYRAEIEAGDFERRSFTRYLGDSRFFIPLGYSSTLALRARGGYTDDTAPLQKLFTLGGVGSVRGYPQNAYFGSRMLLGNAELTLGQISPFDDWFDDVQFFGFADAGWLNLVAGTNTVDADDFFTSAGFGMSFIDRTVRLELAWPLDDLPGVDREPTLWLRLTPTF